MGARRELLGEVRERYESGSRADKRRILDEFVAVTGYHRKHAIRILRSGVLAEEPTNGKGRLRLYDESVGQALVILWEASDRICGKRLKPLVPLLIEALERHGHLRLDTEVRRRVLRASAATIDRLLAPARAGVKKARQRGRKSAARRAVPVRTFADWNDPLPGFMEGDLVAHCGESVSGSFVNTFCLTDIASGWTECVPLLVREAALVTAALEQLRENMPVPLRGFDSDNGSEFLNEQVIAYCTKHGIEFTRSRPYRKNDQAWVEQKNGSVVRRLAGYRRLEGVAAVQALSRLYSASRLFVNFFQPSFKLAAKTREGARVIKQYYSPKTPYERLLESADVPDTVKERLRAVAQTLDPLSLLDRIRTAQYELASLAAGQLPHVKQENSDLDGFLGSLVSAWQQGEVRPTHQREPKPQRDWRTRADPFEDVWPTIQAWLEQEPDRTAKELLERLQTKNPGTFTDGQLRTLQRRVKAWRTQIARHLIFAGVGAVDLQGCEAIASAPQA